MKTKHTIKKLGEEIRQSNTEHQTTLRSQLESQMETKQIKTKPFAWKPLFYSLSSMAAVIVLAVIISPGRSARYETTPSPNVLRLEQAADMALQEESFGSAAGVESAPAFDGLMEFDDEWYPYPTEPVPSGRDQIDYKNEHGDMLEQYVSYDLLAKDDIDTDVRALFSSLGGHIQSIDSYSRDQVYISGLIPVQSLHLFSEELSDLVKNDAFIIESLSATDLIPQAINQDEQIASLTESREELEEQVEDASGSKKEQLERQLEFINEQIEDAEQSREDLDSRVDFATVTVSVTEIPSIWQATDYYDLELIITGYDEPGFLQRIGINVLFIIAWFITLFSVTFWFVIPIAIWLRRKQKTSKALRTLE